MCLSKTPKIETPPPVQAVKQPETAVVQQRAKTARNSSAMGGGSLLTGPTGIGTVSTGKTSLLGG